MILGIRVRPVASELSDIDRVVLKWYRSSGRGSSGIENWQFLAG